MVTQHNIKTKNMEKKEEELVSFPSIRKQYFAASNELLGRVRVHANDSNK